MMIGLAYSNNSGSDDKNSQLREEFESFFREFYGKLCDFAVGYVRDTDVAEDIVQSVFLNLWEQKQMWDDLENAQAYLYKSVRNEALNYIKHEKVVQDAEAEVRSRVQEWKDVSENPDDIKKLKKIIQQGINTLPSSRRKIYRLSRESGLTYKEIADVLSISIKTVETQIGRALKALRAFVSKHWHKPLFIFWLFLIK